MHEKKESTKGRMEGGKKYIQDKRRELLIKTLKKKRAIVNRKEKENRKSPQNKARQ